MIVYIHIPKTAGSAMDQMFRNYIKETNLKALPKTTIRSQKNWDNVINQKNIDYVTCHINGIEPIPNDLVYNTSYQNEKINWVTLIRNPIKRIVSEYYFLKHGFENFKNHPIIKNLNDNEYEFPNTLKEYVNSPESFNAQTKHLIGKKVWDNKQVDTEDADMIISKLNKINFYVGITDYMNESIEYFNKIFNFSLSMLFHNVNKYKNYKNIIIGDDIKEDIKKNNTSDYKLYNYYKEILIKR